MSPRTNRYLTTVPAPGVQMGTPVAVNPHILASNANLVRVFNEGNKPKGQDKSANHPGVTSAAHDRMVWRTFLMEALLGGTETMRAAGKILLPMYSGEKQKDWQVRLQQAVLFNYAERTASDLSGRLFKTPPKTPVVEDGLRPELVNHLDDVDGEGTGITEFMQHWFKRGLELGLFHVLVTTPKRDTTTAIDRKTPTWSFIHPDNVLFAHQTTLDDGTVIIDHLRILEVSTEMDGFREVTVRRIRVYEPGSITVYKEDPEKKEEEKWIREEVIKTDWDRVPLVTFYSNKIGFMEAIPPLQDLAYLNTRHWQSYSDQASILTIARFPILVSTGASNSRGSQTIGPRKMFKIPDANGKLQYVEHTGQAIKAGTEDLEMLEHMMSNYGSEFLKSRPGSTAATSRALDSAESTSLLHSIANTFEDSVHELLVMTVRAFDDHKEGEKVPRVEFTVDLSMSQSDSTELTTLDLARRRHDISREAYLTELKRRDILSDTFEAKADWVQVQAELVIERKLGLLKVENQDGIPNADNLEERASSGKSSRGKPDNAKGTTGEEDGKKDAAVQVAA